MTDKIMQTIDLAGASYSIALLGMVATSVLLLMGSAWVSNKYKLSVTLCGLTAVIGVFTLFESRVVWLSELQVPLVYHYVGWIVSMPLQIIALYFFARSAGSVSIGLFWRLLTVSILMVLFRYLGESGFVYSTLAFLIGVICWLYILGEIFFGQMDNVISKSLKQPIIRGYFWLRIIVTIGWAIYPLANFIISFSEYVDAGGLSIAYNLTEFLNRMAFGLIILTSAVLVTKGASDDT